MRFLTSLSLLIILFTLNIYAKDISLSKENNRFAVTEKSENSFKIINQLNLINTNKIKTENGEFVKLTVPYYSSNSEIGSPELPSLKKLISVPNDAEINIEIIHKESKKVKLSEFGINQYILPRQPSISKGLTADEIVFHINNKIYKEDRFFQDNIVSTELLGKMREVQLARIIISPFSYIHQKH